MAGSGRRSGNPPTKEHILTAAREHFAAHGYDRSSIRAIAASAGVDPALVHHYFGTKEKLFLAVLEIPFEPATVVATILAGPPERLAERLVSTLLAVWDDPVTGPAAVAMLRASFQQPASSQLLREFFLTQVLRRVASVVPAHIGLQAPPEEVALRFGLVASQLIGVATMRYVLQLEPLASVRSDVLVTAIAPTIRRYLGQE